VPNFRGEETGNPVIIEQAGLGKTIVTKHARDEGSTLIRSFLHSVRNPKIDTYEPILLLQEIKVT